MKKQRGDRFYFDKCLIGTVAERGKKYVAANKDDVLDKKHVEQGWHPDCACELCGKRRSFAATQSADKEKEAFLRRQRKARELEKEKKGEERAVRKAHKRLRSGKKIDEGTRLDEHAMDDDE
jgi:hypothetical protein